MNIVEKIQQLCETNNISISLLEKELGFSRGSIYKWHKSYPKSDALFKMAKYFNVSMESFLSTEITKDDLKNGEPKGAYILLSDKDRGKGIPPEVLQKLTDFYCSK
jgi:transcriptional regulator with XRE-family HTH domain